jgi:hypothetical protein
MTHSRLHPCLGALGLAAVALSAGTVHAQDLDNIPLGFVELRVTTCNVSGGDTNDDVFVDFGFTDRDANGKPRHRTYELDKPGDDRAKGATDSYVFPGFGQLGRLDVIQLRKSGLDDWCVSGIELRVNGQGRAMSYSSATVGDDYLGAHADSPSRLWIDDHSGDAPAPQLSFSDTESISAVKVGSGIAAITAATVPNSVFLNIKPILSSGDQNKLVTIVWRHDGVEGSRIRFKQPSDDVSIWLGSDIDTIESLQLQESVKENGGFSYESITVTGTNPFAQSWATSDDARNGGLGKMGLHQAGTEKVDIIKTPTHARGNRTPMRHGFSHLPLRRTGAFDTEAADLAAHAATEQPLCQRPSGIERAELERLIATLVVDAWKDACKGKIKCTWGEHKVSISRVDASKTYVHVQFRVTVEWNDREFHFHPEVEFKLSPTCASNNLVLTASDIEIIPNFSFIQEQVIRIARNYIDDLDEALDLLGRDIDVLKASRRLPQCPSTMTVDAQGGITATWPRATLPPPLQHIVVPNVMCLAP